MKFRKANLAISENVLFSSLQGSSENDCSFLIHCWADMLFARHSVSFTYEQKDLIHSVCHFVTGWISLERITFFFISQNMSLLGLLHIYYQNSCECSWHDEDHKQHQVSALYQVWETNSTEDLCEPFDLNTFQKIVPWFPRKRRLTDHKHSIMIFWVHYDFLSKLYFKQK